MINWHSVTEKLPEPNQMCWITHIEGNYIAGPFPFKVDEGDDNSKGAWLDLFSTPEAGTIFTPDDATHWAAGAEINRPTNDQEAQTDSKPV